MEDYLKRIADLVRQHGYAVQAVHPDASAGTPAFCYTVGLELTFDHPELAMVGFHPETAQGFLSVAVDAIRKGRRLDKTSYADEIGTMPVAFVEVIHASAQESLPVAVRIVGRDVRAMQLVLPDAAGLFPWEAGCDERYASMQTALLEVGTHPLRTS